jgi:hypothetical protein
VISAGARRSVLPRPPVTQPEPQTAPQETFTVMSVFSTAASVPPSYPEDSPTQDGDELVVHDRRVTVDGIHTRRRLRSRRRPGRVRAAFLDTLDIGPPRPVKEVRVGNYSVRNRVGLTV